MPCGAQAAWPLNAGASWLPESTGTREALFAVRFADTATGTEAYLFAAALCGPDTAFAAGAEGTLLKTVDGGRTWTALNNVPIQGVSAIHFLDRDTGWVAGDFGELRLFHQGDRGPGSARLDEEPAGPHGFGKEEGLHENGAVGTVD